MPEPDYEIVDLSIPLVPGMYTFPGDTPFAARGPYNAVTGKHREFCYQLDITTQTGTHIQGPHYFLAEGKRIDAFPLSAFEGPAVVLDVAGLPLITEVELSRRLPPVDLAGHILLLRTGFMDRIVEHLQAHGDAGLSALLAQKPGLSLAGAAWIGERRPKMLGIDSFGVEPLGSVDYVVNHLLCEQGLLILESLVNLARVPTGAWVEAFPLPVAGVEGTPCRALAKVRR